MISGENQRKGLKMGRVVFLGVEGSGKSVLTVALVRFFEKYSNQGWSLLPENKEAFVFQERMPKMFSEGSLPSQTANFRHLRWSICHDDKPQRTLDILDYPGEVYRMAFLDPNDGPNSVTLCDSQQAHSRDIKELLGFIKGAEYVFVLFNIDDAKNLDTDNRNVDAVWVTLSALKIITSMNNAPEVTLLITQADRLESEGESLEDIDSVVQKYLPLIAKRFKSLPKLLVSGVDIENPKFGLLPMVSCFIEKSDIVRSFVLDVEKFMQKIHGGLVQTVTLEEYDNLRKRAEAISCFTQKAREFLESKEEMEELFEVKGKIEKMEKMRVVGKEKKKLLVSLKEEVRYLSSKRLVSVIIEGLVQDEVPWISIVLILLLPLVISFILVACSSVK